MRSKESIKLSPLLFLLTAGAGISMFVSAWNSFIQGKAYIYLSLFFLILFLLGLLTIYFYFLRIISIIKNSHKFIENSTEKTDSVSELVKNDFNENRKNAFNLLKAAFSKPDSKSIGEKILQNLSNDFGILQGVFFILKSETDSFIPVATFALDFEKPPAEFILGEGINGQAVADSKIVIISNLPDSYSHVISGLGKGKAKFLYVIPLVHERKSFGVVEFTVFKEIDDSQLSALNQLMREGGTKLHTVLFSNIK